MLWVGGETCAGYGGRQRNLSHLHELTQMSSYNRPYREPTRQTLTLDCAAWAPSFALDLRTKSASPYHADWLGAVESRLAQLPNPIREAIDRLEAPGPLACLHLKGLRGPAEVPPTPENCRCPPVRGDAHAEFWLALFAQRLGWLFAHAEICEGQLFHHIAPVPGEERAPSGESSVAPLRLHKDGVSHPVPPDYVLLWCHRGHDQVGTTVASAVTLVEHLTDQQRHLLQEPVFRHRTDYEFHLEQPQLTPPHAILSGPAEDPEVSVDVDFVEAPTPAHARAVEELEALFHRVAGRIVLAPGELLILDNRRAIHARDAFQPRYDGTDRWLQTAYCRRGGAPDGTGFRVEGHTVRLVA